jgi:hypothetical protein
MTALQKTFLAIGSIVLIASFGEAWSNASKPEPTPAPAPSATAPQPAGGETGVRPAESDGAQFPEDAPATPPAAPSAPPAGGAVFCPSGTCAPVRQSAGRSYYRPARRGLLGRLFRR